MRVKNLLCQSQGFIVEDPLHRLQVRDEFSVGRGDGRACRLEGQFGAIGHRGKRPIEAPRGRERSSGREPASLAEEHSDVETPGSDGETRCLGEGGQFFPSAKMRDGGQPIIALLSSVVTRMRAGDSSHEGGQPLLQKTG